MISAIVCVDNNWGIGSNNDLLVSIPEDMKRFKEKTVGNVVIMGRKTYESLPVKPLPNRVNVVVTSDVEKIKKDNADGVAFITMDCAKVYLDTLTTYSLIDYYIIGGGQIYKELLPYCDCVYVTKVNRTYENADTFFPNIDEMSEWKIKNTGKTKEYDGIKYQFYEYRKRDE